MTPERWQQIRDGLSSALAMAPGERSAYLDSVGANDPALRTEIASLLAVEQQASPEFLCPPTGNNAVPLTKVGIENNRIGWRIGPYQLVEEIGVGGMGEVYRAFRADDQFCKEVAIKLVRSGEDSRFVVSRFKSERQLLASLDHPNVAALFDGGTTDEGVPYFAMELIEGQPITEYCDTRKLSVRDRLELFLQVCSAVQYAHQRLIIHRDLKPSNILVTSTGIPKLLDFGIAKILEAPAVSEQGAEPTISLFRLLTPAYASPEQIRGEAITTASDIYSLGVLLYELLTGHRPYRIESNASYEIAKAVCEFEPEKPSATVFQNTTLKTDGEVVEITPKSVSEVREGSPEKLSRRLRGDLDNIVLMALRKEPPRRYPSVEQLAADIRRHLEDQPVSATRDTLQYRLAKFVSRHKAGFAAAIVVTAAVIAGMAATLYEARIAHAQQRLAEQRFNDVRELARSNLFEFNDAIQNLPGAAPARHLVIQRALGYLDKLSRDSAGDQRLMSELAAGYERIASLQGNFSGPGIGDSGAALASYQKAWTIRESLAARSDNDVKDLMAECDLLNSFIRELVKTGRTESALQMATRGISVAALLTKKQPHDRAATLCEARAHRWMGWAMGGNGSSGSTRELPEAIMHDRKAIELLTPQAGQKPDRAEQIAIFQVSCDLATHLSKNREFGAALKVYDTLWATTVGLRDVPPTLQYIFYNYRSQLFEDMGNFGRAVEDEHKSLAIARAMTRTDPHDLVARIATALAQGSLGIDEARLGNKVAGKKKLDEAIAVGENLLASDPQELFYKDLLLLGYACEGEILSSMGDQDDAAERYTRSLTTATELAQQDPSNLESHINVAILHGALGVVLAKATRHPEARHELSNASMQLDDLLRLRPQDPEVLYVSRMVRDDLAALEGCVAGHACSGTLAMQLPKLSH